MLFNLGGEGNVPGSVWCCGMELAKILCERLRNPGKGNLGMKCLKTFKGKYASVINNRSLFIPDRCLLVITNNK